MLSIDTCTVYSCWQWNESRMECCSVHFYFMLTDTFAVYPRPLDLFGCRTWEVGSSLVPLQSIPQAYKTIHRAPAWLECTAEPVELKKCLTMSALPLQSSSLCLYCAVCCVQRSSTFWQSTFSPALAAPDAGLWHQLGGLQHHWSDEQYQVYRQG